MGMQPVWLDQADNLRDNARNASDADKREMDRAIAARKQQIGGAIADHWQSFHKHASKGVEQVIRIGGTGLVNIEADREAHANGELDDEEFADRIAEYQSEIEGLRAIVDNAREQEERVWSEVSVTEAEYERYMAKRAPALFQGGKNLLHLPADD